MTISQIPRSEFEKTIGYITTLCGYPALTQDKMNVLIDFLRLNHGYNTADELTDAYRALASARLEEKVESFKSLSGLSASRVLQSYLRAKRKDTAQPAAGDRKISEENRKIIKNYNGRDVIFQDDLTTDERNTLMRHWINESRLNYKQINRPDLITSTSFDFLSNEGTLRVHENMLQRWTGHDYVDLCSWSVVRERAGKLVYQEEMMFSKNSDHARRMMSPVAGTGIDNAIKRMAVAIYFDSI
jgi:hypothetical protein